MKIENRIEAEARRFRFRMELRQLLEDAASPGSDATLLANVRRFEKEFDVFIWRDVEAVRTRRDLREKELHSRRSRSR